MRKSRLYVPQRYILLGANVPKRVALSVQAAWCVMLPEITADGAEHLRPVAQKFGAVLRWTLLQQISAL